MGDEPRGCLGFLFRSSSGAASPASGDDFPRVQVNKYFVSKAEADFFRVLYRVVGNRAHILAQVSPGRLVWFPGNNKSNPGRQSWHNRIDRKSVDFVLCDPVTLKPYLVIELDEPSHSKPERQTRDEIVDQILEAAGLPVVRVLTSDTYDTRELEAALGPHLPKPR